MFKPGVSNFIGDIKFPEDSRSFQGGIYLFDKFHFGPFIRERNLDWSSIMVIIFLAQSDALYWCVDVEHSCFMNYNTSVFSLLSIDAIDYGIKFPGFIFRLLNNFLKEASLMMCSLLVISFYVFRVEFEDIRVGFLHISELQCDCFALVDQCAFNVLDSELYVQEPIG